MYEGIDVAAVKADWAAELACYSTDAAPIAYALEHLPAGWPPNAAQFKALCLNRPPPPVPQLPAPKPDMTRLEAELSKLAKPAKVSPLAWAYALQDREKAGESLSPAQRWAWREALKDGPKTADVLAEFTPIPRDALPPAMREQAQ